MGLPKVSLPTLMTLVGAVGGMAPPDFGRSVNLTSTRKGEADACHIDYYSLTRFSDFCTALMSEAQHSQRLLGLILRYCFLMK